MGGEAAMKPLLRVSLRDAVGSIKGVVGGGAVGGDDGGERRRNREEGGRDWRDRGGGYGREK